MGTCQSERATEDGGVDQHNLSTISRDASQGARAGTRPTYTNSSDGTKSIRASSLVRILQILSNGVDAQQSQLLHTNICMEMRSIKEGIQRPDQTGSNLIVGCIMQKIIKHELFELWVIIHNDLGHIRKERRNIASSAHHLTTESETIKKLKNPK
jgi:hypothetical protein